jgi:hypothetical protein
MKKLIKKTVPRSKSNRTITLFGVSILIAGALVLVNKTVLATPPPVNFATPAPAYPIGSHPNSVTIGDFNLDGKPDLVTANAVSATWQ